jgi:hypothetical protein
MKHKTYESDSEFLQSLDAVQRAFFLRREKERWDRLQEALRELSRGTSVISALNGDVCQLVLGSAS